ncbi:tetratricopeptide repeat protein 19, mitochondrial isoform X2 [Boleophthalmus pectinirostris]|uniref:tetratricopeptide repeat protein 19, mitochondrial isoform X2 n=1 Tax=Boleophthalmus pectinirostris TaxID=150288 RepID=UPI0024326CAA|nr:tetratricopeptide repeat protein 19, mitochondrial isoform X2 [Boleophthalmus pectinirostris]
MRRLTLLRVFLFYFDRSRLERRDFSAGFYCEVSPRDVEYFRRSCQQKMAACVCRALRTALAVTGRCARTGPNLTHTHRAFTCRNQGERRQGERTQGERTQGERTQGERRHAGAVLWPGLAFSLFGRSEEDERDEAQKKEDEMILLLKKAKLSLLRDQLVSASSFLHQALALAQQLHHQDAQLYCYSQMANLAFVRGQLDQAERLFKSSLSILLSRGIPENDNAVIETSLKLAAIYAQQNRLSLAEHGFRFCVETLEEKLEKEEEEMKETKETKEAKETTEESTEEAQTLRRDSRLLLGLALDSRARFWTQVSDLERAEEDYRKSLKICSEEQGPEHPQTLVLLSDLASVLDLRGNHSEALVLVQRAVDLGRTHEHPDLHVLLCNLAAVLMHTGDLEAAATFYHEALSLSKSRGDEETTEHLHEELKELKKKKDERKKEREEKKKKQEEEEERGGEEGKEKK